jgi:hypothetical protein
MGQYSLARAAEAGSILFAQALPAARVSFEHQGSAFVQLDHWREIVVHRKAG